MYECFYLAELEAGNNFLTYVTLINTESVLAFHYLNV